MRVELTTDWGEVTQVEIEELARPACQLQADTVGLSLQDGKRLLERVQQAVVQLQAYEYCQLHRMCKRSHRWNPVKDYYQRKLDTISGRVCIGSPRTSPARASLPTSWRLRFLR